MAECLTVHTNWLYSIASSIGSVTVVGVLCRVMVAGCLLKCAYNRDIRHTTHTHTHTHTHRTCTHKHIHVHTHTLLSLYTQTATRLGSYLGGWWLCPFFTQPCLSRHRDGFPSLNFMIILLLCIHIMQHTEIQESVR